LKINIMLDILNYEMTAYDQKDQFNSCQREMIAAYKSSKPFPTKRLLQLFPALAASRRDILKRGPINFSFSKKFAETDYEEEQMLTFGDPALGQVFFTVPAKMKSKVEFNEANKTIELILIDKIEMQVNKLAEEGLNRSAFQIVKKMKFQNEIVITVLEDVVAPQNITNLIVYLTADNTKRINLLASFQEQLSLKTESIVFKRFPLRSLDEVDCCDGLLGDQKYLVYKRKGDPEEPNGCVCNIKQGHCGFRGEWEVMQDGFETKEDAEKWVRTSPRCNH